MIFKKFNVDTGTDTGPRSEEESYISGLCIAIKHRKIMIF